MTETTREKYIAAAVKSGVLPKGAHRNPQIFSLSAPNNETTPIQFWQLFSILGPDRIVAIVEGFYQRVFADEDWFTSVFARVGGVNHHINTQASMWADVMGGGPYYHGAEFRLEFHHTHNAHQLMTAEGAKRWVSLMVQTLDASDVQMLDDPRVRLSLNTFLSHFLSKYAEDFAFENRESFGKTNPPITLT
jgi:truncated hemoglobin YjbI